MKHCYSLQSLAEDHSSPQIEVCLTLSFKIKVTDMKASCVCRELMRNVPPVLQCVQAY